MPKPFLYKDSHRVRWKYDVTLISNRTGKEEVCFNICLGQARLTKSGQFYILEELEKMSKEIGKSIAEPVRNRITIEEHSIAEELLKTIRKADYSVIQQLNKSLA